MSGIWNLIFGIPLFLVLVIQRWVCGRYTCFVNLSIPDSIYKGCTKSWNVEVYQETILADLGNGGQKLHWGRVCLCDKLAVRPQLLLSGFP